VEDQEPKARTESKQQNGLRTKNGDNAPVLGEGPHWNLAGELFDSQIKVQGLSPDLCAEAQLEDKSERKIVCQREGLPPGEMIREIDSLTRLTWQGQKAEVTIQILQRNHKNQKFSS
jgi:hypothetical protein